MRTVVWSDHARTQYLSALTFLAERNATAAETLADRIRTTLGELAKRPIGRPGQAEGTFEKIVRKTRYLIVFELAGDELHVHRLFHMSQDWRAWSDEPEGDA